jgi:YidC/Oxa1 family membrane protein insertase
MEQKQSFDLQTFIGIFLIGLILVYFTWSTSEQASDAAPTADSTTAVTPAPSPATPLAEGTRDSTTAVVDSNAPAVQVFELGNEVLQLRISNEGGAIQSAQLTQFQTWDSLPLHLVNNNQVLDVEVAGTRLSTLRFAQTAATDSSLSLAATAPNGTPVVLTYTLPANNYQLRMNVQVATNAQGYTPRIFWGMQTLRHEKSDKNERIQTGLYYHFAQEDKYDYLSETSSDEDQVSNLKWVAFKQQYFSSILLNDAEFTQADLKSNYLEEGAPYTKELTAQLNMGAASGPFNHTFNLYYGPNRFQILKSYGAGFEKLIPLGWGIFGWINRFMVLPIFKWLEAYNLNYGLIILIMAILIKVVLSPFTWKSYQSMMKMRVLKPEVDAIAEKFKGKDAMKQQQATMELYRQAGVNPLGGCIPLLFQMPIIFAVFRFFPASIELRQQSFLWADDLSTYDSIATLPFNIPFYGAHVSLFTLLFAISTLIYTYFNNQLTASNNQFPQLKWMMYLMPIMFIGVFNNYSSGLTYYYTVANILTFSQQGIIKLMMNEDAIHAKIQNNKTKPVKKSRIQRKLDEMLEQQKNAPKKK